MHRRFQVLISTIASVKLTSSSSLVDGRCRMRDHYRQRRDLLHHELCVHLGGLLDMHVPEAGMHLVGWLPPDKDDQCAAALAVQVGVEITAISNYSLEPLPRGGLLFGYAGANEAGILRGVQKLAAALGRL